MNVQQAKAIARQWVAEEGSETPGFCGAFFHGSVNNLLANAILPPTSDVDVMIVLSEGVPGNKLGKFVYEGVLLEVSYLPVEQLSSAEAVLGNYHLAGSFRVPSVIADSAGRLTELQAIVSRDFAKRYWVQKRCEHARSNCVRFLDSLSESAPFHNQVTSWLFANGVLTHVLLVAGLQNPTVRTRYVAAKELLSEYGRSDFYKTLLDCLGCVDMTQERTREHLITLSEAFTDASAFIRTPYQFAADLSDEGRPVAIDGSQDLIERGLHREAIFWMVATYGRCLTVLAVDAPPEVQEQYQIGYRQLAADLGITSFADLEQHSAQVRAFLPRVEEVAQAIQAANPAIDDSSEV